MNRKQVFAAAALVLAGSAAFAQGEIELQHFGANQQSTTTREAVRNEVVRTRASGQTQASAEASKPQLKTVGAIRADMHATVKQGFADGSLTRPSEAYPFAGTDMASTRTREEVRAEAIAAKAARVQAGH